MRRDFGVYASAVDISRGETAVNIRAFVDEGLGNSSYEVCIINDGGYALTVPVNGNGCGGSGYAFSFNSAFEAWAVNNFAFLQP